MYYLMSRSDLNAEWEPVLNKKTKKRLSFKTENAASDEAAKLARSSSHQFSAIDNKGYFVSVIYTGKNPYESLA